MSDTPDVSADKKCGPFLIIGPGSVLYNWLEELETWAYFTVRSVASLVCQVSGQPSLSGQWPAFPVRSMASLPVLGQWPPFTIRSVASLSVLLLGQWPAFTVRSVASRHCQIRGQPSLSGQWPVNSRDGCVVEVLILLDLSGFLQSLKVWGK